MQKYLAIGNRGYTNEVRLRGLNDSIAGSGKSAIYQIAGTLIPSSTLVISPLIALQRDQAESIAQQDVGEAALTKPAVSANGVTIFDRITSDSVVRSRLEMMRGYAEVRHCRREYLLNYFGEKPWGEGLVICYEGNKMVILFDDVGYKTLSVDLVTQRGLLKQAG